MRLDTDSADLRAQLAEVRAEVAAAVAAREATAAENAELRRRLREMEDDARIPRRNIDRRGLPKD